MKMTTKPTTKEIASEAEVVLNPWKRMIEAKMVHVEKPT